MHTPTTSATFRHMPTTDLLRFVPTTDLKHIAYGPENSMERANRKIKHALAKEGRKILAKV